MVVRLRRTQLRILPIRATVWTAVVLCAAVWALQMHPVAIDTELAESEGMELTADADADVVVVLDYTAIRQSEETFSGRDFSAVWIDLFHRELGPVSVATPETLSEDHLESARLVVLTRSVTAEMPEASLERIRRRVLDGAVVVVDRPGGEARRLFSADGEIGPRKGQAITHADGLSEPFSSQLEQMPLLGDYIGSTAPRDDARTLLAIDGAPAIYAADFGDGVAITVDFDFPRQLVAMRQGMPDDDFGVRPADGSTRPPRTSDLIADDAMVGAEVPYADVLERFVFYGVLMRYAALPSLWGYPDFAPGAVVFAHEDDRLGDRAGWKSEYEHRRGASSMLLSTADAGLTNEGTESIADRGAQIGLAWRIPHPSVARWERIGIGPFQPMRKPVELADQRRDLSEVVDDHSVNAARTLGGLWTEDWSAPLSAMAENGIRADLSYSPEQTRGFAFGTGRPFLGVGDDGIPLPIRVYPTIVPLSADDGPSFDRLLELSADGHHQVVTVGSRPSKLADYPDLESFDAWIEMFDAMERHNHRAMTVSDYRRFQSMRRSSDLRSRIDRQTSLPDELQSERTAPDHTGHLLRIAADAPRNDMHVLIPATIGDAELIGALEGARRAGTEIITDTVDPVPFEMMGFEVYRLPLDPGTNVLEAYYR